MSEIFYDYTTETGELRYQVVRGPNKSFKQRRPDGKGGWVYNIDGIKPLLYRLPETLEAIKRGEPVFIVRVKGMLTTLPDWPWLRPPTVRAGKWQDSFNEYLKDAEIVILPDNDSPGRKHAEKIARSLWGVRQ